MNNGQSKDDSIVQLKQMIIFLKSELAKYQNEVAQLKKNDYYSLSLKLEEENFQLKKQEKQLSLELLKGQREFEKELASLQKELQEHEEKRIKLVDSVQLLVKEKNELRKENMHLVNMLNELQEQSIIDTPSVQSSPLTNDFEQTFLDFVQKTHQQLDTIYEEVKLNQPKSDHHIIEKIEHESNDIKTLLHTMKEANTSVPSSSDKASTDTNLISHLDNQIQMIYSKALNFEKQLEQKIQLLDNVEQQLIQLTNEIEEQ